MYLVLQDQKERQEQWALEVLLEQQDHKVKKELKVRWVQQAQRESEVLRVSEEKLALRVLEANEGFQG